MTHAQPILPEYLDGDHMASVEPGSEFMRDPNARSRVDGMPTVEHLIKTRFFDEQGDESWM
jgi:hypothetical protein